MNQHLQEEKFSFVVRQLPILAWWKNLDLEIQAVSDCTLPLINAKEQDEVIGITDYDVKCKAAEKADIFRAQDRKVISEKRVIKYFDVVEYHQNEPQIIQSIKAPLYCSVGKICGVSVYAFILDDSFFKTLSRLTEDADNPFYANLSAKELSRGSYELPTNYGNIKLSKRQSECMFYLIRGNLAKQIANKLGLSPRTIEYYIELIKAKYKCYSKNELIELAISHDFLKVIPESLL